MIKTFYITTPIYYVNDVPHIGHAYTTIAADVLARYHRQWGHDVFFLTGLDEHGQKVQQAAQKAAMDPKAYCDRLAPQFQTLWKRLNISNNAFIRTTDPKHKAYVQKTLKALYDKELIYRADYTGWYCTFDERFWTEKDVVQGLCPDCKRPVERLSESNYFFRMSQYQDRLITYIQDHPDFIQPQSRSNEVLGFLQKPLEDLSISRPKSRLSWGIDLPFDSNYVTYVWFDALVNYISALEYLTPKPSFEKYWTTHAVEAAGDRPVLHLAGKDTLTTHAVYWSTMLMALDLALPTTIFAHGWWTVEGEKMSKSRGNVGEPHVPTTLGHLLALHGPPALGEDRRREREVQSHQDRGPVHGVCREDVFADEVQDRVVGRRFRGVGGPVLLEGGLRRQILQRRDVVHQCVEPDVGDE